MKTKLVLTGIALFFLIGCTEKNKIEDSPASKVPDLVNTEYYGCIGHRDQNDGEYGMDTVFYQKRNDTIVLVVNLYRNCGYQPTDSTSMSTDTANIYIDLHGLSVLGCVCDFEYNYYFVEYGDQLHFNVFTRHPDYDETEYTLWRELNYP